MPTLRELRQRKQVTQQALAETLGTSAQRVSAWETGRMRPSAKYLLGLAAALGVSTDEILRASQGKH